ncbi:MAG: hypothetical protein FWC41_10375, partial [Firmicutes bacterium]|nr:hypothetical protein [Bacillota bacterium]
MKNTISLCLGIIFLMNICAQVFANDPPKGNPLNENPEYYALVRTKFEEIEKTSQNSETACVFSIKPKFWFWSKDYRVVRVHNMPHVLSEEEDGFLRSNLKLFLEARKIATYDSQIATATGKAAAKIFTKKLKARLSNSDDMKVIANFLGTDKETAMESFICAFGMACVSQLLGAGITASLAWMEIFVPL